MGLTVLRQRDSRSGDERMAAVTVPLGRIDAGAAKVAPADAILVVDDIVKRFETLDGVLTAVDHVSLSVAPGEFVGVIGPSGCGKSTLFNVIGGLLDGYEGTVKVAGERVRGPHRAVGMIFQEESTFRSEEHTSELQSQFHLVCRLLLEKKKK